MAKKIKFPLVLRNDQRVYTIEELRDNFHLQKVYEYFSNGKLAEWLDDRHYEEEARQVRETDPQEDGAMGKLCDILAVEYAGADLFEKFRLKSCTDEELKEYTENSFGDILDDAYHTADPEYLGILCSPRFLDCLYQVAGERKLAERARISINKLAYGYLTGQMGEPDGETAFRLERLSRMANWKEFAALSNLELDGNLATYMALAGASSDSRFTNIRRVNFIICTSLGRMYHVDSTDCTMEQRGEAEKAVSGIYRALFPDKKILFKGVMLDTYGEDSPWMTDAVFSVMYEITTAAVLDLVDGLGPEEAREILESFTGDYAQIYGPEGYKMRILLKEIPERFTSIRAALREING